MPRLSLNGRRIQDLHFYLRTRLRVVIIENKAVQPVAIVINSIIQVGVGRNCQEPTVIQLLYPDDLVDLGSDVDWLVELDLHVVLEVIHELGDCVG